MPTFHITTRPIGAKDKSRDKQDSVITAATLTDATFSTDPNREVIAVRQLPAPISVTRDDITEEKNLVSQPML